ncbi:MAG: chemotaxis protein CheW [Desulfococcaceae bacterium]|jgi:chemotaxis-related protein WspB|nr:chemotaxis protein CheW [Desulfococcaceae bacterium]
MKLALLFYLGDEMYTVSCDKIKEIVPMMQLSTVQQGPEYFAGFFNYRGEIVPVIDLCCLIRGESCRMRLSTRIILVSYTAGSGENYTLGLIAERITETIRKSGFRDSPVRLEEAPFLGEMMMEGRKMIRHIYLDLLPDCITFLPHGQKA